LPETFFDFLLIHILLRRFNNLTAGLKMFQPRAALFWEEKKEDVSLARIGQLIARIKSFIITPDFDEFLNQMENILIWKKPLASISALIGWLLLVNLFDLWMIPFILFAVLLSSKFGSKNADDNLEKKEKKIKKSSAAKDFKFIADSREGS
jgi:hypothetical protein